MTADYTPAEHTPFAFSPGVRVKVNGKNCVFWVTFNKPCEHRQNNPGTEQCIDPKRLKH